MFIGIWIVRNQRYIIFAAVDMAMDLSVHPDILLPCTAALFAIFQPRASILVIDNPRVLCIQV
jgi:hypothetical protein